MKLVIVESPAKAKTIQKYLGQGYHVTSSFGHIRDLPKSKLGVDTAKNFQPQYIIPTKAKKNVAALKKAARQAQAIYFATDEDREGEAIAWHLAHVIDADPAICQRITFDEITKSAIKSAIASPRPIDQNLVDAQQARRVLDRLVGYELSPLLWKKIRRGLSAGRVQSVAVRLIVEREEEIQAFKPEEYWSLTVHLSKNNDPFTANLFISRGQKLNQKDIKSRAEIDAILSALSNASYTVSRITTADKKRSAPPPFTTSTLQQAAFSKLGFSSKKTMLVAQKLYEGIELGPKGPVGLITYMRTDSVHLAAEATKQARDVITAEFGSDYALPTPRQFRHKAKGAQEAHEAIRPTKPSRLPQHIAAFLSPDQMKLYQLIWQRMIASQMADARLKTVTALIDATTPAHQTDPGYFQFKAIGTTIVFAGFARVLGTKSAFFQETILPELAAADQLDLIKLDPAQHFTQPPARYSEATLVRALEHFGIGRPSTYAPTIDTVQKRAYVEKNEAKRFVPTEIGTLVTNLLKEHFPAIVDTEFTATVEADLDQIASGQKTWQPVIKEFYQPFHRTIEQKQKELSKDQLTQEKTGELCPTCQHELVIKLGRFGKFKACSHYPECKYTENIGPDKVLAEQAAQEKCPNCGKPLTLKRGRFGPFMGCSGYPDCKHIKPIVKTIGVKCPKCKVGDIIEKRSKRGRTFYACDQYPTCQNAYWSKPNGDHCPRCHHLLVFGTKNTVRCSNKDCGYTTASSKQK